MSRENWTNKQQEAICVKDCNLLVSAAAGSGKTSVLVERIIRKINDNDNPVDIDKLLVVTFTNNAANEMKEKIADSIYEALEKSPGSENLQRQILLLAKANIMTLHAFCLEIVKNNFQKLEIDPDFKIANETEIKLMKEEIINDFFEEIYEKDNNDDFFDLLESFGRNNDDAEIKRIVLKIYDFIQNDDNPVVWLDKMTQKFNPEGKELPDECQQIIEYVHGALKSYREDMFNAFEIAKRGEGLNKVEKVIEKDLFIVNRLVKDCETKSDNVWDKLVTFLKEIKFERFPSRLPDGSDTEKKIAVKEIRDNVKGEIDKIKKELINNDIAQILKDMKSTYPRLKCISELVMEFAERFEKKKKEKSMIDFNDMEHYALKILSKGYIDNKYLPSDVAVELKEKFEEILVDEYQDINDVQESLIGLVSKHNDDIPNVFMVGDVKQSIYRFRHARPELFLEKYMTYSDEEGEKQRKIILPDNFRSREEIIDAVNFVFRQIMNRDVGEINYSENEYLKYGANYPENNDTGAYVGGLPEIHIINSVQLNDNEITDDSESNIENTSRDENNNFNDNTFEENSFLGDAIFDEETRKFEMAEREMEEEISKIQAEARFVIKRIQELMSVDENGKRFLVFDKKEQKYRPLRYRDIVILMRSAVNWSDVFLEEMTNVAIPVFADTGTGFFASTEINIVLSLLKIIDNPLQDIPLLAVMRSPIYNFSTNELTEIRLASKNTKMFEALKEFSNKTQNDTSKKVVEFMEDIDRWTKMSLHMQTDKLIWQIYSDTDYYSLIGALPNGKQRQANLKNLFEKANQFEDTSLKGLFSFINFTEKISKSGKDMDGAKILGENDDVVRIMTVHKSKGLEFPIVFLSGCGKNFNMMDMRDSIILHQTEGFGPKIVDTNVRISYPSTHQKWIKNVMKKENLSEEMRILYVAMTRAREKLIITGNINDLSKSANKWALMADTQDDVINPHKILVGNNYFDWLGPAILRNESGKEILSKSINVEEFDGLILNEKAMFDVHLWQIKDFLHETEKDEIKEEELIKWLNETVSSDVKYAEEIKRRLNFEYLFKKAVNIPVKISVSEVKKRFLAELNEEDESVPYYPETTAKKPMFLEEKKGINAAEKGTIIHFVMMHLDFKEKDVQKQLDEMIGKELITKQQAEIVEIEKIEKFIDSQIGKRMAASNNVNREMAFNMNIPCKELYTELDEALYENETFLMQGIIDCWFEENDGIVLLDYKTDRIPEGGVSVIKEKYKIQIDYYAKALEMLSEKPIKTKCLYLFDNGETVFY